MEKFIPTYVMHCKKLKNRKEEFDKWTTKNNIKPIFITDYDSEELNEEIIKKYYKYDSNECYNFFGKIWKLNLKEISLAIKHIKALEKFMNDEEDVALFLEDDAIPITDIKNEINECLIKTPKNADFIFIGKGVGEKFIEDNIKQSYKINDRCFKVKKSNCSEAYIVTKKAAQKIIKTIIPFHFGIDWELAYQFRHDEYNVYWWIPPIFEQGSKNGKFESSLDHI